MSSPKQRAILALFASDESRIFTLDDIVEECPAVRTYTSSKRYLSETMTKLVRKELVERVGRGKYRAVVTGAS